MDDATFAQLLPIIKRLIASTARRHRMSRQDGEDFESTVMVKLLDGNYRVLGAFQGRSSVETFLSTVVAHAYQDFRNQQWGKWRPSLEARRLGETAILLERYTVRDGYTFDEACHALRTNHAVETPSAELEALGTCLPVRFRRRFESDDVLAVIPGPLRADVLVSDAAQDALLASISRVLDGERAALPEPDATIFALRFDDGRKVSEIAVILGLEQKPLYERINRIKLRLRRALETSGVGPEILRDLFDRSE